MLNVDSYLLALDEFKSTDFKMKGFSQKKKSHTSILLIEILDFAIAAMARGNTKPTVSRMALRKPMTLNTWRDDQKN